LPVSTRLVERALARRQLNEYPDAIAGGYKSRELHNSNHTMNFTMIPRALVPGKMDHLVHLILGAVLLSVGWGWRATTATPATR